MIYAKMVIYNVAGEIRKIRKEERFEYKGYRKFSMGMR